MTDAPRRRRRRAMPARSGTIAEGLPNDPSQDPEVADLNETVEERAAAPAQGDDSEAFNPANRLREVGQRATGYEREYRLKLIHRLLMRGIPLDTIANQLMVSVDTVERDRREIGQRLRKQASTMDANEMIGDTMAFYGETQAMALKMASSDKTPLNTKLAAIRTALSSRNDRHRFLQASGVFDALQFSTDEDGSSNDLDRLMQLTERLIESDDITDDLADMEGIDQDEVMIANFEEEQEMDIKIF